jgi:hypothetical protein
MATVDFTGEYLIALFTRFATTWWSSAGSGVDEKALRLETHVDLHGALPDQEDLRVDDLARDGVEIDLAAHR